MYLSELLTPPRCLVPLEATTLADAGFALVRALSADGAVVDEERLRERLEDARPEDVVGYGDRGFVLHYRTDAVSHLAVAIGVAPRSVCRELGDGEDSQCARVVALVVAPRKETARHLQVVGALGQLFLRPSVVAALEASRTPLEVATSPAWQEVTVEPQLTVRDIMSARPRSIGPDAPLRSAVLDMRRAGVGALPVVDDENRVIGILSERELLRHLLSHYLPRAGGGPTGPPSAATRRTVREVMTRQVLCVAPHQPLAEVASLMLNKDVERVPVVRDGILVGFLTRGDIVRKLIGS
jgi:CBS domain-containing protein/mannitol/fructose-specific phosphotransferase system IIA component (Ntr-type)